MKAHVRVNPFITVEVEGSTTKELFGAIAGVQEILSERQCGACGSQNIRFKVRPAKDRKGKPVEYYECACNDCEARLSYGQSMDKVSLFPKRKLTDDGEPDLERGLPGDHKGWTTWKGAHKATD